MPVAPIVTSVLALTTGYIRSIVAEEIGLAAMKLGAGRSAKTDTIDPLAGIICTKSVGDRVKSGEEIARAYASDPERIHIVETDIRSAFRLSGQPTKSPPLIYETIESGF
jgi:thymidine phosphorylase